MDAMSVEDLISDISGMDIDDPEDTFFENITELWAFIDKLVHGFNAHFDHISETQWGKMQTKTFDRLKQFLQDNKHVLKNNIVLRICNLFYSLQGTIGRYGGNLQIVKQTHAKDVRDITARILLAMQVKKRRRGDDFQGDHATKSSRAGYPPGRDLHAQWQAIDRLATLLSR
jgi:hypothetical protein